ncbi:hypothetical protein C2I27_04095 [Priestia megaterium]|uniref:hypothetical protein n=1 Tax=Priestia megaterium TaxID=1404 RepID=UPI000D50AE67|nr:hypothetical protein [Priestia megaterium]PVC75074.1 hypothetical protein C2I27_04095 [Priestia megaterium]
MSNQFDNSPDDIRVNVVSPKQKEVKVVALSNQVTKQTKTDEEYEKRIAPHIEKLNTQEKVLSRDKSSLADEIQKLMESQQKIIYNGERVRKLFHSLNGKRKEKAIDLFEEFNESGAHYVFDIETFGDSNERDKPYGISEVSMNKYDVNGEMVEEGYNAVIQQNKDVVDSLQTRINELSKDKYSYNKLPEWEKRSIVDLMRYASYKEETDTHAFSSKGGIQHHSIIESVFDYKDQVDHGKVIREMDMYLKYMQSGLNTLKSSGEKPVEAMTKVANLMKENPESFFVSYNGNQFDMPVIKAFAEKMGVELPADVKHLDYLNVIKTVFMDSDDLKRKVNPEYNGSVYGKDKLAAFRGILPEDDSSQQDAHNATVDTNDTAKVVAATRGYVKEELENTKAPIHKGYNFHPTEMTWSEESLTHGQTLFSSGGIQAYGEGEESFRVAQDENGNWKPVSNGFNKTVINSKTFYKFAGHEEMGDGKQAFRFFDPERNEYSYIVRDGEHAFDDLRDFVQGRFYNWEGIDSETQREISHAADTDRARRRYDRYFGLDGAGKGLTVIDGQPVEKGTSGFSGLKRMLANTKVMEEHLSSNGEPYRQAVDEYVAQGYSKNQAKKMARKIRSGELMDHLDFNSMWDDEKKEYTFNQSEKEQFFKMYKRLIDERPYLEAAVQEIDASYESEIKKASAIPENKKRREALISVNQKRDQALMRYQQMVVEKVGAPTQDVELKHFEKQRLSYFDPEVNDTRSINFETVETARSNMYSYARKGVEEGPNRQRVIRERMANLLGVLSSQEKTVADNKSEPIISKQQYKNYMTVLHNTDSVWTAAGEIAIDMRTQNSGKYDETRVQPAMNHNINIKELTPEDNKAFIQRAIQDTENARMVINTSSVEGKKIELGEEMRRTIDWLDQDRFSRLNPKNYEALEELLTSIHKHAPGKHVALAMDSSSDANVKAYVYEPKHSVQVQNQLQRGTVPSQALEINMPLINQAGTHKVGNMVLNAHSIATLNGKNVEMISSAQQIARGYASKMRNIMQAFDSGDYEKANTLAKRTLRNEVQNMSGIQRNMEFGENDSYKWANNQSDALKQSHVKMSNAMVEDLFYNGYDGIQLTKDNFYDWDNVSYQDENGNTKLKRGVTFDDVDMETSHKLLMKMPKWAEDKMGKEFFTSSIKAEHVSKGILSMEDVRQLIPYGTFYNHGRDNAVQYMNAYLLNDNVKEGIEQTKGVSRDTLLITPRQLEYQQDRVNRNLPANDTSINMKTAYMTQDQLRNKIEDMYQSKEGKQLLSDLNFLDEHGQIEYAKLPRLYEQQGIIAKDVSDMLEVDNEKRYTKGKQFNVTEGLQIGDKIAPGTVLGERIHDNGYKEQVRYEGNKEATIMKGVAGNEDLVLQWQSDPFKIMLDGEKMTDSPVDRRFIQALTGRDDIVAIINPDVAKHKDFGMLMSGEARLLAEGVNELSPKKKQQAIQIIENGNVGLTWNEENKGFIDNSFGEHIDRNAFDEVFANLNKKNINISPVTTEGVRYGILDAHLSKVSNYSKVVDHTGRAVLGFDTDGKKIYGEKDGVQWGHREMGVLKSYGLEETYNHVFNVMKEKSNRTNETVGVKESLRYLAEDKGIEGIGIQASEFESLPEVHRTLLDIEGENVGSYKGTIFDKQAVQGIVERMEAKHGPDAKVSNGHGFWFELPSVERTDGKLDKVTVNMDNGKLQELDRIFIPFTSLEGANGDIHLRDMQKHIANIYKKADAVNKAEDITEARKAHSELQSAVSGYMKQSFKELSSSKGMMLSDLFKTHMDTSASGLFKLMDFDTSQKYMDKYGEGQYTVISEETAKKMGVYDDLKNGAEKYVANVRYPTFHDGAMQFTKLQMADWVKEGEIHTTSFSSMLQNADSDGDYSHIVLVDDEKVQKEWKQAHDSNEYKFKDLWEEHEAKSNPTRTDYEEAKPVSLSETEPKSLSKYDEETASQGKSYVSKAVGNSDEEMASKIGKMTIGRASNLNLFIRQVADRHYSDNPQMNTKMKQFGAGLEQKLIDAKHGAEPAGLKMIDAIYKGDWNEAIRIDDEYFDKKFVKDFHMADVAQEMPMALTQVRDGLRTQGFKFGTSTGIQYNQNSTKMGIKQFSELLHGTADPKDLAGDNKAAALLYKYLREIGEDVPDNGYVEHTSPLERLNATPMKERTDATKKKLGRVRNLASDAVGGSISDLGNKASKLWDSVKNMSGKKAALIGGGLALTGIAGYNILNTEKPEMHYKSEEELPSGQEQVPQRQPVPALDVPLDDFSETQNAAINIQASGRGFQKEHMSQMVTQGMQDIGMNAGPTRISVTHQDNTQQLNRQWYRDKVRENI